MAWKPKQWTDEEILALATNAEFYVHKYKDAYKTLRKMCKRLCKEGKMKLLFETNRQYFFQTVK